MTSLCSFVVHSTLKYLATVLAESVDCSKLRTSPVMLVAPQDGPDCDFQLSAHSIMLSLLCTDLLLPLMLGIITVAITS